MKKISGNNFPPGFENLFGSDPAHFIAKHSRVLRETKNFTKQIKLIVMLQIPCDTRIKCLCKIPLYSILLIYCVYTKLLIYK